MRVPLPLSIVVTSNEKYYRITAPRFHTPRKADHLKVVDGQGAVNSLEGARYNYPGVLTVYLTAEMETCFAERMFYLHRQIVRHLDVSHIMKMRQHFSQHFILWEIEFTKSMHNVFDLWQHCSRYSVFPSMMTSPSQDYEHLKKKRAEIQHDQYEGLVVPSSRSINSGKLIVLFNDQSKNVTSIDPFEAEFRLVNQAGDPFANPTVEILDFGAGEVKVTGYPGGLYANWTRIDFNH